MILNHKAAIELLVEQAAEIGFNRYTILNLHALLSDNLLADPRASGRLRAIAPPSEERTIGFCAADFRTPPPASPCANARRGRSNGEWLG